MEITASRFKLRANAPERQKAVSYQIWHELTHWVHMKGPATYRDAIRTHYRQRTQNNTLRTFWYGEGRDDRWWRDYAGRVYVNASYDTWDGEGIEVPTTHIQLLADPLHAVIVAKRTGQDHIDALALVLEIFAGEHDP